ncbi:hypothetical protein H1C71_007616 [Ictidomys tridecemlineatus]|nr:hypothetical protein H1C71_007616 [Ictidomys tridecemlineatus]
MHRGQAQSPESPSGAASQHQPPSPDGSQGLETRAAGDKAPPAGTGGGGQGTAGQGQGGRRRRAWSQTCPLAAVTSPQPQFLLKDDPCRRPPWLRATQSPSLTLSPDFSPRGHQCASATMSLQAVHSSLPGLWCR